VALSIGWDGQLGKRFHGRRYHFDLGRDRRVDRAALVSHTNTLDKAPDEYYTGRQQGVEIVMLAENVFFVRWWISRLRK
jgi:hypothetical protein